MTMARKLVLPDIIFEENFCHIHFVKKTLRNVEQLNIAVE